MRNLFLVLVGALLLAGCSGSTASAPAPTSAAASSQASGGQPEKSNLKIGVGGQGQIIYLPLTLADQLGYFKDEGLSVEINDQGWRGCAYGDDWRFH